MRIITTPDSHSLRNWLETLPRRFREGEGQLLYSGRNEVRLFTVDGRELVVKRFRRHDWLKRIVYTFFRTNKARRSFENAVQLIERGFTTPRPAAYVEERCGGLITQVYYVSAYTSAQPIEQPLVEQEPFDAPLATAYAHYVARLHEAGVLHRDLNRTNVLYTQGADGSYAFELIDINRMRFYADGPVPTAACMENLTLLWWLSPVYRHVLRAYAGQRGWSEADVQEAIRVKQRHDRRWVRRKSITGKLKKLFK